MKRLAILLSIGLMCFAAETWVTGPDPAFAYEPGAYGRKKDAPMFISWREWDGEVRMGGVAKMFAVPIPNTEFAIELVGSTANKEHQLFGYFTTNILIKPDWKGTIQIGTNFYPLSQLTKPEFK